MGFASGIMAVALVGMGAYLMMSKDTKKQVSKTINSAMNDANRLVNKMN